MNFLYLQDYGVNKQVSKKKQTDADSKLAPPLVELMKMLFNVETYRSKILFGVWFLNFYSFI